MTRRNLLPALRPSSSCIATLDPNQNVEPMSGGTWVETALAHHGVELGPIAVAVADSAVFAARESIAEQGVRGELDYTELNALYAVIRQIVVNKLREMVTQRISHFPASDCDE